MKGANLKQHFNSIKVRLERARGEGRASYAKFQFHKGTIRTVGNTLSELVGIISIP